MIKIENINNIIVSSLETTAQMAIGQAVLKLTDKTLTIIEKSVQWSLPSQEIITEENGKSLTKVELVRPLPWILFLPSLLILRIFRISFNTIIAFLGYPRFEPSDMIRIIQKSRRRVRALKNNGLKNMRHKKTSAIKDKVMTMKEASKSLAESIKLILSTLSCLDSGSKTAPSPPPTKIHVSNILNATLSVSKETKSIESSLLSSMTGEMKRKFLEINSENLLENESDEEPLVSKIEKLANEFGSDKDYCPTECSSSDDIELSEPEADVNITLNEVQDIKVEKKEMEKAWCANPQCINTLCNYEQHKLNENLAVKKLTTIPRFNRLNKSSWKNKFEETMVAEKHVSTLNGVINERDITYYSPISWRSVSSDLLLLPNKQENQIDVDKKTELNNEEINIQIKCNNNNNKLL